MTDWSKADWVDPKYNWTPKPVTRLPERVLIDYATRCNLRCPMCLVWGAEENQIESVKGLMDEQKAEAMLAQLTEVKPLVQPNLYGEPLLIPNLMDKLKTIKSHGMTVALNTNGLNMTDEIATQLIEVGVDSVFFSIDAVNPETYKKIRGVDKMEKVEAAVLRMLALRGDKTLPRIGVTMTISETNRAEEAAFVERWAHEVDCVRVGLVYEDGVFFSLGMPEPRAACHYLYSTMVVHNNGSVAVCCLDALRATDVGNVFEHGVEAIWGGEEFAKVRYYHETGQWDKVPFCKNCNGWAWFDFEEEVRDGLFIRRSPVMTYYNLLERMNNWQGRLRGAHEVSDEAPAS